MEKINKSVSFDNKNAICANAIRLLGDERRQLTAIRPRTPLLLVILMCVYTCNYATVIDKVVQAIKWQS
jgi:hypothetical protein